MLIILLVAPIEAGNPFGGFHGPAFLHGFVRSPFFGGYVCGYDCGWDFGSGGYDYGYGYDDNLPAAPAIAIETALAAEREMLSARTGYQAAMSRIQ